MVNAFLAAAVPGALLSCYSTAYELALNLRTGRVSHLLVEPQLVPVALKAAAELGLAHDRICVFGGAAHGLRSLDALLADARRRGTPRAPVKPAVRDTLAFLVFSSGTSGRPKGAPPAGICSSPRLIASQPSRCRMGT